MISGSNTQKMAASNPQSAAGGVPLFVDADTDLVAKPGRLPGSWYLSCAFASRGKTLAFLWHQMFPGQGTETRFLLANCSDGKWFPHVLAEPLGGAVGVSSSRCEVSSSYGTFSGDRSRLVLKVKAGSEAVDVVLVPGPEVLYNGTLGTLPLFGMQSYEYGFPNVVTNGTMTIDGEEFPIDSATAWFDRQFGSLADPSEPAGKGAPALFAKQVRRRNSDEEALHERQLPQVRLCQETCAPSERRRGALGPWRRERRGPRGARLARTG